jgi:recombinational DNA repair protein (RecF pathway)
LIIKNTDPYKTKKCVACKRNIALNVKYFTYPLSLQQICIDCAEKEIPKTIELLEKDLQKIRDEKARG